MRNLAQELRRVTLLLEGICFIRCSHDLDFVRNNIPGLSFALRGDEISADDDRCAGLQALDVCIILKTAFRDDLKIAQTRTVVELDEGKILRVAPSAHPALDLYAGDRRSAGERGFDGDR